MKLMKEKVWFDSRFKMEDRIYEEIYNQIMNQILAQLWIK